MPRSINCQERELAFLIPRVDIAPESSFNDRYGVYFCSGDLLLLFSNSGLLYKIIIRFYRLKMVFFNVKVKVYSTE